MSDPRRNGEWRTVLALVAAYAAWALATVWVAQVSLVLAILLAGIAAAFHSSLNHEALHGHPTGNEWLNGALVFPALLLFIPYLRFRDTHLAHHIDAKLTDPYDDPETNFLDPGVWIRLPGWLRAVLRLNNTLFGRMLIGPLVAQVVFMRADVLAIGRGEVRVLAGWLLHVPAVLVVVWWARAVGEMPGWAYLVQAYLGVSLLKIRTYLEHRAHEDASGRTVIIEDRGPLALLFLNNNYHIVHHSHPGRPWYQMQRLYYADPEKYRALNRGYVYAGYGEVFRRYFLHAKDPVAHPLWHRSA
jgi:fatty acid desaturase